MTFRSSLLAAGLLGVLGLCAPAYAQEYQATGRAVVDVKKFKDQITARAEARTLAERDAIKSAMKLSLNIDPSSPKAVASIDDFVKSLTNNLNSTFRTEGNSLTATTQLTVGSAILTDLARSLGLQDKNVMEASSVIFIIDEYWGIATHLDPTKPLVSEVEVFQDKSSFSDTSAKGSKSSFSDTSAKGAASASEASTLAASSKESSSIATSSKESLSVAASDRASIDARKSRTDSASGTSAARASSADDSSSSAASARASMDATSAQTESVRGTSSSSLNASSNSDNRLAAASNSDTRLSASSQSSSSASFDNKDVKSLASTSDVKNIQQKTDVTVIKTKTVFPDVNNAKPDNSQSALISQRLAQETKKFGLENSPERDLRETGKGKMLIADIETQRRWDEYTTKAGKNPYNAKYVVFGTAVMNAEGQSSSGQTQCAGMLKLTSFNVATGRDLASGTISKIAVGSSDQDCRSVLSGALATELAQTVGQAASRELQLVSTQGQSYSVKLFSNVSITRSVRNPFFDALSALANGSIREDDGNETSRTYTVSYKGGDFSRQIDNMLNGLGDVMKSADVQNHGNRFVVCIEGKCPTEF